MKRIHIIDATAYIFRAFHGIRELTSPTGFPTNAIYGYIQMLISILKEYRNEPVLAVFDSGKPSFRKEIYDLYKANRPEIDPNLKMQIPKCIEFTSLMGIPSFSMDGFEADDIIATYAKMAEKQGYSVVIHSSDKDLMQLINDSVILYDSMRSKTYNANAVKEKFGVGPELVGDLLSLMGDSSDNIPGVRGIGPKTAAKLLEEYGSLDKILENAANTGKSVATKLTEHLDDARLSRILVTLKEDVPVTYALEDIKHGEIDADALRKELSELGFGNFLRQVLDFLGNRVVKKTVPSKTYEVVDINDEGDAAHMEFPDGMAIYASWGKANPLTDDPAIIAVNGSKTWVFSVKEDLFGVGLFMDQIGSILRPFLENPAVYKTGCDIKFIISLFRRYGIQIKGVLDDVFIAAYVLNPNEENYNLADLAARCDDVSPQTLENLQATADFKTAAGASAGVLKSICAKLESDMKSQGDSHKVYNEIEKPLINVLARIEENGVLIDTVFLQKLGIEAAKEIELIERQINDVYGQPINLGSPKQLGTLLFEHLNLPAGKKTKTGYSTDAEVLEKLSEIHFVPALIIQHRTLSKLKNTYIDVLPAMVSRKTARLHARFNQTVAATGRLSSSDPNLQNIPVRNELGRKIREAFIAPAGRVILSLDYSQIELRVLAHLCRDEGLLKAFREGQDIHAATAMQIFNLSDPSEVKSEMRSVAKEVNFGVLYGQTGFGLSKTIGISRTQAKEYIQKYFEKYPAVRRYLDGIIASARRESAAFTLFGRRRPLIFRGPQQGHSERMAMNTPIQGTAADIIKIAMIKCQEVLEKEFPGVMMVLTVHDELVFELDESDAPVVCERMKQVMETAVELDVPLKVDGKWAANWALAH